MVSNDGRVSCPSSDDVMMALFIHYTPSPFQQQVEEQSSTFQQYEITNNTQTVEQPQYEVAIIDSQPTEEVER